MGSPAALFRLSIRCKFAVSFKEKLACVAERYDASVFLDVVESEVVDCQKNYSKVDGMDSQNVCQISSSPCLLIHAQLS